MATPQRQHLQLLVQQHSQQTALGRPAPLSSSSNSMTQLCSGLRLTQSMLRHLLGALQRLQVPLLPLLVVSVLMRQRLWTQTQQSSSSKQGQASQIRRLVVGQQQWRQSRLLVLLQLQQQATPCRRHCGGLQRRQALTGPSWRHCLRS
jgi:hypothetical protein